MQYQQQRPMQSITIARLILSETGTYNPMFSRPYETYVSGDTLNAINNRIDAAGSSGITGSILAGVASTMLKPTAAPQAELMIPYGWAERRIRFILEAHVTTTTGSSFVYYFQGYTSHLGVGRNGAVDPNMEFIINSFIRVNRASTLTPYGYQTRDIVTESAHVINGVYHYQQQNNTAFTMRPQDVFVGMQSNYIAEAYRSNNPGYNTVTDTRLALTSEPIRSKRSNNLPSSFIANVIDNYKTGVQLADFGQGEADILTRCQELVYESSINENIFIRAISNMKGVGCAISFTMADLERIDRNIAAVTNYVTLGATQVSQLHQTGQTAYWNSANRETVVATILSNAVPAIMMDLMINKIFFRSTNHDIGGIMNTVIIDAKSITNADLTQNFELFKRRLEKEILFDITYGNQDLYMLEMNIDLFGETTISLSVGNSPMTVFSTPSFCDSLMTPVITTNKDNFNALIHDFDVITNNIKQSQSAGLAINTSI